MSSLEPETYVSSGHKRNIRKVPDSFEIEVCLKPSDYLYQWIELYKNLINRHNIKGLLTF